MNKESGEYVAIKIVRKFELSQIQVKSNKTSRVFPCITINITQKASVLKEVQIMRTLNHSSIIKMLDFIETKEVSHTYMHAH